MTTLNRALFLVLLLSLAICVGAGAFWYNFTRVSMINAKEGVRFNVPPGATYKTISTDLSHQHLISHPLLFNIFIKYSGKKHNLKAGEYVLAYGSTPLQVLNQLTTGAGLLYHSFTVVPGSTFRQLRSALNKNSYLKHVSLNLSDAELAKRLGIAVANPEGLFFPDTYYFALGSSDLVILKNAYIAMQEKLNYAWQHRAANLPLKTPYEVLIAASIIEKETGLKEERPIIAAVLENRLRQNILLQFDPTVIYGLGARYEGKIYLTNLRENNPYNTYVHKGLPPTPISMPSLVSITAITQPDQNNYLYFVAKGDGLSHQFSTTLLEHYTAVAAAKNYHPWYFNADLMRGYLIKIFGQKMFNTN